MHVKNRQQEPLNDPLSADECSLITITGVHPIMSWTFFYSSFASESAEGSFTDDLLTRATSLYLCVCVCVFVWARVRRKKKEEEEEEEEEKPLDGAEQKGMRMQMKWPSDLTHFNKVNWERKKEREREKKSNTISWMGWSKRLACLVIKGLNVQVK